MPEKTHVSSSRVPANQRVPNRSKYLISGLGLLGMCFVPWKALVSLGLSDDQYSHIVLVPFIAAGLMYLDRDRIFRGVNYSPLAGIPMAVLGIALCNLAKIAPSLSGSPYHLSVLTVGGIVVLAADFLLCFGFGALCRAAFPLGFLLLMIPVPKPLMSPVVLALQDGSAAFTAALFKLLHVPALRQGLTFSLPGFDIEIAQQCSGIRSSIALSIASILAGHLFLRAWWRKLLLVLITIPLALFKNAVRIVAISSLGLYVSQSFLHGTLHHYSGLPFSLLELAIVGPILIRWHRLDTRGPQGTATAILQAKAGPAMTPAPRDA